MLLLPTGRDALLPDLVILSGMAVESEATFGLGVFAAVSDGLPWSRPR